jgi:hypothetical protein
MTDLFEHRPKLPAWFTAGSTATEVHMRRVSAGLHPTGFRLASESLGKTCGDCDHVLVRKLGKRYYKCGEAKITSGPASDIRLKWPACVRFEHKVK